MPNVSSTAITGYVVREFKSFSEWLGTRGVESCTSGWTLDQKFAFSNIYLSDSLPKD